MSDDHSAPINPRDVSNRVGQVFRPASPVDAIEFFVGRVPQYQRLLDTIGERGKHAIVYGERAVGKSSLISILDPLLKAMKLPHLVVRSNCGTKENFGSLWRGALGKTRISRTFDVPVAFHTEEKTVGGTVDEFGGLPHKPTPVDVQRCLELVPNSIYIFDEFDRLHRNERRIFADLLKTLSDHAVPVTLILVGIGDTVDDLLTDHMSVSRAVAQVRVPRMDRAEIRQVLEKGEKSLGVVFKDEAKHRIEVMAQGLPHYAHLLGKHAVREATSHNRLEIQLDDVRAAEKSAVSDVDQQAITIYMKATQSTHKDALFQHVLLACALAKKDELGYFRASAVVQPLSTIRSDDVQIDSFMRHLGEFMKKVRGPVLQRWGPRRQFKYRFIDPLLPPLAILKGLEKNLLSESQLAQLTLDASDAGPLFSQSLDDSLA